MSPHATLQQHLQSAWNGWQFWQRQQKCGSSQRVATLDILQEGLPPLPFLWNNDPDLAYARDTLLADYPQALSWQALPSQVVVDSWSVLDLLNHWLIPHLKPSDPPTHWIDIGSKNWSYLPGLHTALTQAGQLPATGQLTGVELDARRRYRDGFCRGEYARCLTRHFPPATYVEQDILTCNGPWQGVTWFLPFLFEDPHLAWGLPLRVFQPLTLLAHVVKNLAPGGWLLTVHLTPEEGAAQGDLMRQLDPTGQLMETVAQGPVTDRFRLYSSQRQAWLWQKRSHVS